MGLLPHSCGQQPLAVPYTIVCAGEGASVTAQTLKQSQAELGFVTGRGWGWGRGDLKKEREVWIA